MFKYLNNVPLKAVGLLENEEKQKTWGRVGQTFDSNINSFEHILTVQERERYYNNKWKNFGKQISETTD